MLLLWKNLIIEHDVFCINWSFSNKRLYLQVILFIPKNVQILKTI